MTTPFPRGVRVGASSLGHGSALGALYSAAWRKHPEHSHAEYWSVNDPAATHRVTVEWDEPVAVRAIRIRFGHVPKTLRAFARRGETLEALDLTPATETDIAVGGEPIVGIVVEQPPGGPHTMRIGCLAVVAEARPELEVGLVRGTEIEWPAMPLASDGDPHTALDACDADALEVRCATPRTIGKVVIEFVGDVAALAAFWPGLEAIDPWTGRVVVDVDRRVGDHVRIALPPPPSILGITAVSVRE